MEIPWGGTAVVEPIPPDGVLEAWRAARRRGGGYPVAVAEWGRRDALDPDLLWRAGEAPEVLLAADPVAPAPLPLEDAPGEDVDELYDEHLSWFVPEGLPTFLLTLPVDTSEAAAAHLDFYGLEAGLHPARYVQLVRSWRERFGAELVACWGTMLQFVVERPPADLDAARALALEQWEVAPATLQLPGVSLRDQARALVGRDTWFLHERP